MKLKNLVVFAVFFLSCLAAFGQKGSYVVQGSVGKSGITRLYLIVGNFQAQPNSKAREIPVKNGKFNIAGELSEPLPAFLSLTEKYEAGTENTLQFVLDKGKITIDISDKLSKAIVKGSTANSDFEKFNKSQAKFTDTFNRLNAAAQAEAGKGMSQDSLQLKYSPLFKNAQADLIKFQEAFMRQNPKAYISLLLIPQFAQLTQNYMKADSMLNMLDRDLRSGKTAQEIQKYLNKEKKTSIGAIAPAFSLADTSGKKTSLETLKGKYVLLDFWASWCGPCRQENPNVVNAYQTFKDKGFTVLGISLDREKKNWLNAIKTDHLNWTQLSDLKYWSNEAAVLYGITAIPRNFLLDPEGKIIARDLRGPALIEKLTEIFKK